LAPPRDAPSGDRAGGAPLLVGCANSIAFTQPRCTRESALRGDPAGGHDRTALEPQSPAAVRAVARRGLKELGVGLAVAVLFDATIVRAILLPASMRVLGEWNWYLPKWLERLPRVGAEDDASPVGRINSIVRLRARTHAANRRAGPFGTPAPRRRPSTGWHHEHREQRVRALGEDARGCSARRRCRAPAGVGRAR
jgi:hypothetical protein